MSTVRWHPRGESERRRSKASGYKFGVTGGWKSTQEMYELIRREIIEMAGARFATVHHAARARRTVCKGRGERHNDSVERCLWRDGWRVASLSECARAPHAGARSTSRDGRMVEEFTKKFRITES